MNQTLQNYIQMGKLIFRSRLKEKWIGKSRGIVKRIFAD